MGQIISGAVTGFIAGLFAAVLMVGAIRALQRDKFLTYCTQHSSYAECTVYWTEGRWPK